ncbi:xaa-Pro aminopeptidase ApepP [Aethina tumida]|uniref:xaa-Pro aminopeptidase ApepP n=1 Tax=Aethina tumida TaxID=116153 RepID=UPI002148A1DF|nr:xaa-Pro aminopeptidase ApepP [Aethina tumida]
MYLHKSIALLTLCLLLGFCSCYNEELKQRGELRKACSRRGHIRQPERRVDTTSRLTKLREIMRSEVALAMPAIDAYIVLSGDEHQSTDVDEHDRRREYISGFSGSYGDAIITQHKAALWTDGRYHLQADEQMNCDWLLMREGHKNIPSKAQWLKDQLPFGSRIGIDPKIISQHMWIQLKHEFQDAHLRLVGLNSSLIDLIWPEDERPPRRSKDAFVWDIKYAGKNYTEKLAETRREIKRWGADAMVVTALDEISWLLNIRGRDVPYSPFVRSYVIIEEYDVYFYVNRSQLLRNNVTQYLQAAAPYIVSDTVIIKSYDSIWNDLKTKSQKYNKILVPSHCVYSAGASHAIYSHIIPEKILPRQSPIIYLKANKNPTEIVNMRSAQITDAAAFCDCLAYFEKRFKVGDSFTEMDMAKILDTYRYEQNLSLGNSFRTIVGFGSNAAQPHYEPTPNTNVQILDNSTIVLDSGGQYYSGTTDVTRTIHFGTPTEAQKEAYTRVLIGAIQFSTLTFPSNMRMSAVDVLARSPLWEVGLDYLHETGHGIGAFLEAHESPIKVYYESDVSSQQEFKPGYFLTNEPGFYSEGEFGVRLENVLEVIEKPWLRHTSGHEFLGFKVLTLVPYEPKLLKLSLLSVHHRRWINNYHEQVRIHVGAELKRQNKMDGFYWMMEKTKHIPEYGHSNIISCQPVLIFVTNVFLLIILF